LWGPRAEYREFLVSDPAGVAFPMYFMKVPEPGVGKNRWHADLVTPGAISDEVDRLLELGPRRTGGLFIRSASSKRSDLGLVEGRASLACRGQLPLVHEFGDVRDVAAEDLGGLRVGNPVDHGVYAGQDRVFGAAYRNRTDDLLITR
jgi:hypothetical protein